MKRDCFFSFITVPILRVYPSSADVHSYGLSFQTLLYILLALLICFVLVCTIVIVWQYRQIKMKNRYLVQTIVKLNELKFSRPRKFDNVPVDTQVNRDACYTVETNKITQACSDDEELFHLFDEQVNSKKLYLNYNYGRDDYSRIMGVDKNRFAAIIKEYGGGNISTYLSNLRLEYSVGLLLSNENMSVKEIAVRSAFPNSATYYRLFKEKYGISPNTYRSNYKKI